MWIEMQSELDYRKRTFSTKHGRELVGQVADQSAGLGSNASATGKSRPSRTVFETGWNFTM